MGRRIGPVVPLWFEDAIRDFEPDHIVVALRPDEEAGWQERGLTEALPGMSISAL